MIIIFCFIFILFFDYYPLYSHLLQFCYCMDHIFTLKYDQDSNLVLYPFYLYNPIGFHLSIYQSTSVDCYHSDCLHHSFFSLVHVNNNFFIQPTSGGSSAQPSLAILCGCLKYSSLTSYHIISPHFHYSSLLSCFQRFVVFH